MSTSEAITNEEDYFTMEDHISELPPKVGRDYNSRGRLSNFQSFVKEKTEHHRRSDSAKKPESYEKLYSFKM